MIQESVIGIEVITEMSQKVKVGDQRDTILIGIVKEMSLEVKVGNHLVMEGTTMGIKEAEVKVQGGLLVCLESNLFCKTIFVLRINIFLTVLIDSSFYVLYLLVIIKY